ncbi:hypothetical protein D3C87_1873130 [compost metagenome]
MKFLLKPTINSGISRLEKLGLKTPSFVNLNPIDFAAILLAGSENTYNSWACTVIVPIAIAIGTNNDFKNLI